MPEFGKALTWLAGVLGVILLGAIGSGLWNLVLDPTSKKFIDILGRVSTLGVKKFQGSLYRQVATRSAFYGQKLLLFIFMFIMLIVMIVMRFDLSYDKLEEKFRQGAVLEEGVKTTTKVHEPLIKIDKEVYEKITAIKRYLNYFFLILAAFSSSLIFFEITRRATIHAKIIYFDRVRAIASAFISYRELTYIDARFATIRSKEEYDQLLDDLWDIIEPHHVENPDQLAQDDNIEVKSS